MEWIASADKLHPDKPGVQRYEQIPCLIVKNREILLRQWNCEHLVWDTEDGDDFYCKAEDVTHWMPLPSMPSNANVTDFALEKGRKMQYDVNNPPPPLMR